MKPQRRVKHGSKSGVKQFNTSFELLGVGLRILQRIEACENSRDIARQLGCSKSNVTYWTKKLLSMEAIRLQCRDVFKYFTLTPFGEDLLRRSSKVLTGSENGFVVPVVFEDYPFKFGVVEGEKVALAWGKLGEPRNWVKLGVRVGGVRVERTSRSVIIHPGPLKGFCEEDLLVLADRIRQRVKNVLENRFGMVLAEGVPFRKKMFRFYTREARELGSRVGNVSVDDVAILDRSPPERVWHEEYESVERARAKRLLLSPDGLIRVEAKIDSVVSGLAVLVGEVHQLIDALRECTSPSGNGGVPGHIVGRDAVGVS